MTFIMSHDARCASSSMASLSELNASVALVNLAEIGRCSWILACSNLYYFVLFLCHVLFVFFPTLFCELQITDCSLLMHLQYLVLH